MKLLSSRCARHGRIRLVHLLLAALIVLAAAPSFAAVFTNPIVEASPLTGSADPSVVLYRGDHYDCRSIANGYIGVASSRRLQDIGAAPVKVVFRPPAGTAYSKRLWAPELQQIGGPCCRRGNARACKRGTCADRRRALGGPSAARRASLD